MNEKKKTLTDRQVDLALGMVDDPLLRIGIEARRGELTQPLPVHRRLIEKLLRREVQKK